MLGLVHLMYLDESGCYGHCPTGYVYAIFLATKTPHPEGVTRELGARADNGLGPYTSLIKTAFMGGFTG